MKWAVIESGEITNIYTGAEPPPGSVEIPADIDPYNCEWDGSAIVEKEPLANTQQAQGLMRFERDQLLAQSDWTQLPDSPLDATTKATWATYRQALRDVPADNIDITDVSDVVWPTPPSE